MPIAEMMKLIDVAETAIIEYKALSADAADVLFNAKQNAKGLDDHINRLVAWREELLEKLEKMKSEAI